MKNSHTDHWPLAAFLISVFFFGFNAIGVRYVIAELPPFWAAALRFAPAGLILFILAIILRVPIPRGRSLSGAIIYGALSFGASYAFLYQGLEKVKPGMTQVILALVPLFTLIFAMIHRQENFRWNALLGAVLALAGIAIVFREQLQENVPILSLVEVMLGSVCIAEGGIVARSFPKNHPITANAVGMLTGAGILYGMSLIWREPHPLPTQPITWIALWYLIIIGSCLSFILFLYILKYWPASTNSYQFVLLPFVTVTASAWLTHEKLSPVLLIGAVLVLLGVFFGAIFSPRKKQIPLPVPVSAEEFKE
jgi:drug/metabolite transporter (DMT)-like permease